MKKKRIMASFPIRILAVSIPGLLAGLFLNATRTMGLTSGALNLVVTARYVLSQIITFLAPLIIIGLVASSIISVKKAPTPVTAPIVRITYFSMLGAAAFASVLGYLIIPRLPVSTDSLSFRFLPDTLFELPIPAPVSALSALVLAILLALGACWTNAVRTKELCRSFWESPFPRCPGFFFHCCLLISGFLYVHWLIRDISSSICHCCFWHLLL
ncbi:MAG: hypothetical protein ACLTER_18935 [Ruminococcus sp.]